MRVSTFLFLLFICINTAACEPVMEPHNISEPVRRLMSNDPRAFSRAVIKDFDVDRDGQISADELALGTIQVFESLDRNGDLKLDRLEFGHLWSEATDRADTNHDGVLSFAEILRDQDIQFHRFDRDGDGYLDLDELEAFAKDRLNTR